MSNRINQWPHGNSGQQQQQQQQQQPYQTGLSRSQRRNRNRYQGETVGPDESLREDLVQSCGVFRQQIDILRCRSVELEQIIAYKDRQHKEKVDQLEAEILNLKMQLEGRITIEESRVKQIFVNGFAAKIDDFSAQLQAYAAGAAVAAGAAPE